MNSRVLACCAAALLVACSHSSEAPPPSQHARLASGVVAAVGGETVSELSVARIAAAEHVAPAVARDRALQDALFAVGARSAFRGTPLIAVLERSANARALLEIIKADASARGAPTDEEIARLTELRWRELDRPESARTTHAVALVDKPEQASQALAVAQRIYEAARGAQNSDEFQQRAKAVSHTGVEVRVERLPAVTPDGRAFDPDRPSAGSEQHFDPDFARAATELAAGEVSAPVKSAFGYHVIFCEARVPAVHVPLEERRSLLREEVVKARAEQVKKELLARLTTATPIQISRASDDLTAKIALEAKARTSE